MTRNYETIATKKVKLSNQTYRLGAYVVFQTERNDWQMGKPVDWNEPLTAGLHAGSVSYHRTLKDAVRHERYS